MVLDVVVYLSVDFLPEVSANEAHGDEQHKKEGREDEKDQQNLIASNVFGQSRLIINVHISKLRSFAHWRWVCQLGTNSVNSDAHAHVFLDQLVINEDCRD